MRSLSLLLLDKNTQVVNTHGLVGGLLRVKAIHLTNLQANVEYDLGISDGFILVNDPYSGGRAIYLVDHSNSYLIRKSDFYNFGSSEGGNESVLIYKKSGGSNIFLNVTAARSNMYIDVLI